MKIDKMTPQIAALYLGQKATFEWLIDTKQYEKGDTWDSEIKYYNPENLLDGSLKITPHLRQPNSITEKESQDLYAMVEVFGYPFHPKLDGDSVVDWALTSLFGSPYKAHDQFLYLLSKGFDLFGLIEAGLAKEIKPKLCQQCKKNKATEPHTCPYAEDVQGDNKTLCNCCEDCEGGCAHDI